MVTRITFANLPGNAERCSRLLISHGTPRQTNMPSLSCQVIRRRWRIACAGKYPGCDRGIWLLPVLVGNATMPSTVDLPGSPHSLANVQAIKMSDRSWEHDLGRLVALLNKRIPSLNSITRSHRSVVHAPTPRDMLLKLAQSIFKIQSQKRTRTKRFTRNLGTLMVRALWLCILLLPGWYAFDNHTTPELRKTVFDFLAFAQDKFTSLINWLLPD